MSDYETIRQTTAFDAALTRIEAEVVATRHVVYALEGLKAKNTKLLARIEELERELTAALADVVNVKQRALKLERAALAAPPKEGS